MPGPASITATCSICASAKWFSPADVPGVALPFYLAHPRLIKLERSRMLYVEGATLETCMQYLRHEIGHAILHAYRLNRRRRWQRTFGSSSKPYPRAYQPNPASRRYVHHLPGWYAQSHPEEDFAETFAVWLRPHSGWRRRYRGWPALKKLEYVDSLMTELTGRVQLARRRLDGVDDLLVAGAAADIAGDRLADRLVVGLTGPLARITMRSSAAEPQCIRSSVHGTLFD